MNFKLLTLLVFVMNYNAFTQDLDSIVNAELDKAKQQLKSDGQNLRSDSIYGEEYEEMKKKRLYEYHIFNKMKAQRAPAQFNIRQNQLLFQKQQSIRAHVELQESIYEDPEELYSNEFKLPAPYDSRIDINQLNVDKEEHLIILQRAKNTFCITEKKWINEINENYFEIVEMQKYGEIFKLCKTEPYFNQPTLCIGTAFSVNEDLALTALHVLTNYNLNDLVLIKGFELNSLGNTQNVIRSEDIFEIIDLIGRNDLDNLDVALIKLNKITKIKVQIDQNYATKKSDKVYALGHPAGLPLKLTTNASIKNFNEKYFYASLDTYQGNSGSPVYLKNSHKIIGLLLEGRFDFEPNGNCLVSSLCVGSNCGGEKVLNFTYLWSYLQDYVNN